ncbi:glycosyltransferase family 4 protein [Antrihabitans stalactiti]|nr:glycosyltransferase family 4 protein [Antrihabitans stalactiti]
MRDTALWEDWHIQHVATHRDGSAFAKLGIFAVGLAKYVAILIGRRPDVVHIHMGSNGSFVRKAIVTWLAKAFRVPVVLHIHGSGFHTFFDESPPVLQRIIRKTLEAAFVVVALGDEWAARLAEIAPGARVVDIPNAIPPGDAVAQPASAEPVHVLFLGQIGERKGAFVLVDAWAKLVAEYGRAIPARLTIVGDGEVERATDQVSTLGLGDSVAVSGWIAPEDVPALIRTAQVLVLPSREEGQPMAILEAMANGLCVVAAPAGGIPEMLGDAGILVPADDVDALAAAIARVVLGDDERVRLGNAALARVCERFDVNVVSRRFDRLYREATQ